MSLNLSRSLLRAYPRIFVRPSHAKLVPTCTRTMSSVNEETPAAKPREQPKRVQPVAEGTLAEASSMAAEPKPKRTRAKRIASKAEEAPGPTSLAAAEETKPKRTRAKRVPKTDATDAEASTPKTRIRKAKLKEDNEEGTETQSKPGRPPKAKKQPKEEKAAVDHGDGVELPPIDLWRDYFPAEHHSFKRATTRNPETAKLLAEAFAPEGSKDLVIIESNPGPGQLTRALLALPRERIKKIIVVEDVPNYLHYLHPLAKLDDRVTVIPLMAKQWASYVDIENMGLMDDVKVQDFEDGVHPNLRFIMHLPADVYGEQFVAQLLRTVPDRQWHFKYGRVPLHLIMTDKWWKRITAPKGDRERCKVAVICEAAALTENAVPFDDLQPYGHHFYPTNIYNTDPTIEAESKSRSSTRSAHRAITMVPHAHQVIKAGDLEYWDYVVRKMFVQNNTPIKTSINALGPGAFNLLPKLTDPNLPKDQQLDIKKSSKNLNVDEWELLVNVFKKWPFRPKDLSIDGFNTKGVRENNNK